MSTPAIVPPTARPTGNRIRRSRDPGGPGRSTALNPCSMSAVNGGPSTLRFALRLMQETIVETHGGSHMSTPMGSYVDMSIAST